jgi:pyrroloquinoline quinone biosynthesis protein D
MDPSKTDSAQSSGEGWPRVGRLFRLQWEAAQNSWVLLYPEGMVKLNSSAGEILRRCDGKRTLKEIVAELQAAFPAAPVATEVPAFLRLAAEKGWVEWHPGPAP